MDLRDLSLVFLVLFAAFAFFDGIVLHLWKYKLYRFNDTIYEHKLHTVRAIIFPIILIGFFLYELTGLFYLIVVLLGSLDWIIQILDMWEEKKARTRFGGLGSLEYILHVTLTSLHTSMFLLYLIAKQNGSLSFQITEIQIAHKNFHFVAMNLLPGAIFVALLHIGLCHPYFRETENLRAMEVKLEN